MIKCLGKIVDVKFGMAGHDGGIGLQLEFNGEWGGICYSSWFWNPETVKHSKSSKWIEEDRSKKFDEIVREIAKILKQAKVNDINQLKGIPVEVTLNDNMLVDWRILTEVL